MGWDRLDQHDPGRAIWDDSIDPSYTQPPLPGSCCLLSLATGLESQPNRLRRDALLSFQSSCRLRAEAGRHPVLVVLGSYLQPFLSDCQG